MSKNIDMKCAEYGHKILNEIGRPDEKNKIESTISKALGVLQEDGVYAFSVYVKAKCGNDGTEKVTASKLLEFAFSLLKDPDIAILPEESEDLLDSIRVEMADSIDKLLFAKELLERTLVYARYHAKGLQ